MLPLNKLLIHFSIITFGILLSLNLNAQVSGVKGQILAEGHPIHFSNILVANKYGAVSDSLGEFRIDNIPAGTYSVSASAVGYPTVEKEITVTINEVVEINFELKAQATSLEEVVISGTMKEVSKTESPVPVEVYTAKFFKANPTATVFEALQNVNGVRPQNNCNVCNTGDIHINGLEGPYTMVLIDGMPIVSGLSTVYGLSGIPQSLIERIEIVKGPASTLYGSEAVGGLINIITKKSSSSPTFATDVMGTTWAEFNTDIAGKFQVGNNAQSLIGVNYYYYGNPIDNNKDGFTDVTLQHRISVFNKWNFDRKNNRIFSLAARYIYEDRWGGEMNWSKAYRGGDQIYGESIYTKRGELFGTYQLPTQEKILFQFSANGHDQNSVYGTTLYLAKQYIGFAQLTWNKPLNKHDLLLGTTFRYTYYDDNTQATSGVDINGNQINQVSHTYLPGIFIQDEISLSKNSKLLASIRYDYNSIHGSIITPRLNFKWSTENKNNVLRIGFGNGYRVANVFTEDHASLTGARKVEFLSDLKPETSWNGNVNFVKKMYTQSGAVINMDASVFYTYSPIKL